jgi:hypothetical protein
MCVAFYTCCVLRSMDVSNNSKPSSKHGTTGIHSCSIITPKSGLPQSDEGLGDFREIPTDSPKSRRSVTLAEDVQMAVDVLEIRRLYPTKGILATISPHTDIAMPDQQTQHNPPTEDNHHQRALTPLLPPLLLFSSATSSSINSKLLGCSKTSLESPSSHAMTITPSTSITAPPYFFTIGL